jgi:hypothetical protein
MMNLIQLFLSPENYNRKEVRKNFSEYFFSQPEHSWILEDSSRKHFEKLITLLPSSLLLNLMSKYPVSFVPKQNLNPGMYNSNTVVIYPEFQKLLRSNKGSAVAYLAHELAFIVYELEENRRDILMAEVEADKFVADLGLTFELEELLLMLDESVEKRLRLTYLTINHFTGTNI